MDGTNITPTITLEITNRKNMFNSYLDLWTPSVLLPVSSQSGGYIPSWNLGDNVAPEEGAMDHPHGLWIPVEYCFLSDTQK